MSSLCTALCHYIIFKRGENLRDEASASLEEKIDYGQINRLTPLLLIPVVLVADRTTISYFYTHPFHWSVHRLCVWSSVQLRASIFCMLLTSRYSGACSPTEFLRSFLYYLSTIIAVQIYNFYFEIENKYHRKLRNTLVCALEQRQRDFATNFRLGPITIN